MDFTNIEYFDNMDIGGHYTKRFFTLKKGT